MVKLQLQQHCVRGNWFLPNFELKDVVGQQNKCFMPRRNITGVCLLHENYCHILPGENSHILNSVDTIYGCCTD